ncbi:tetratricopeptide repeat protein [Enterococcus larvae]|uniref:tetratricopeptide repeat protein n=1 Tax=Enterococcus larvae TaxID=2794352 RepID=UPI003F32001D
MEQVLNKYYSLSSVEYFRREINQFLINENFDQQLLFSGKKNTLKSKIIMNCIREKISNRTSVQTNDTVIYIELEEDSESIDIIGQILHYCLLPCPNINTFCKLLPKESTFDKYIKISDLKNSLKETVIKFVEKFNLSYSEKSSEEYAEYMRDANKILSKYLTWLAKTNKLLIVIDKVDLLNKTVLSNLANIFSSIDVPWKLIAILDDELDNIKNEDDYIFFNDVKHVESREMLREDVYKFLYEVLSDSGYSNDEIDNFKKRCYETYLGDPFNTIKYANRMAKEKSKMFVTNEEYTYTIIQNLSTLQQDILVLSSLFPDGIKLQYLEEILKYINNEIASDKFHDSLESLKKSNLIKYKHEKVSLDGDKNYKEVIRDFLKLTSRSDYSIIHSLNVIAESSIQQLVDTNSSDDDFLFYMDLSFHIKPEVLKKHINLLGNFILMLSRMGYYNRIVNIYDELILNPSNSTSIIPYIPLNIINTFLDALQKTSNFEKGLHLSNELNNETPNVLYEARFKSQLYKYEEALSLLYPFRNQPKYFLTYLNILQHMREDEQVLEETKIFLRESLIEDDTYHIILRNTGHLFSPDEAIQNLKKARNYFKNISMDFQEATCLNNLGLAYLYKHDLGKAKSVFEQATHILTELGNQEIYQVYFNMSMANMMEKQYILSENNLKLGFKKLPKSLRFDKIKFQVMQVILDFLSGLSSKEKSVENLVCLSNNDIPDPWLNYLISYNIAVLNKDGDRERFERQISNLKNTYKGNPDIYGIYNCFVQEEIQYEFLLAPSPNWRY